MALSQCVVAADVYYVLMSHAHTTEREEIMGLLLGDIVTTEDGACVSRIWGVSVHAREVKRSDRVEISPAVLAESGKDADALTASLGRDTRVVGWYHSHPHITVQPSHVDTRTQASYQLMDRGFVGLIGAVFESPPAGVPAQARLIAFQSGPDPAGGPGYVQISIPLQIAPSPRGTLSPHILSKLMALQYNLFVEEKSTYEAALDDIAASAHASASAADPNAPAPDPAALHDSLPSFTDSPTAAAADLAPIATLHATSVYKTSLARLVDLVTLPMAASLTDRVTLAKARLAERKAHLAALRANA